MTLRRYGLCSNEMQLCKLSQLILPRVKRFRSQQSCLAVDKAFLVRFLADRPRRGADAILSFCEAAVPMATEENRRLCLGCEGGHY
jgi:hypothetical protein